MRWCWAGLDGAGSSPPTHDAKGASGMGTREGREVRWRDPTRSGDEATETDGAPRGAGGWRLVTDFGVVLVGCFFVCQGVSPVTGFVRCWRCMGWDHGALRLLKI